MEQLAIKEMDAFEYEFHSLLYHQKRTNTSPENVTPFYRFTIFQQKELWTTTLSRQSF